MTSKASHTSHYKFCDKSKYMQPPYISEPIHHVNVETLTAPTAKPHIETHTGKYRKWKHKPAIMTNATSRNDN